MTGDTGRKTVPRTGKDTNELDMLTAKARVSVNENCPYKLQYGIVNRTQIEKKGAEKILLWSAKEAGMFQHLSAALLVSISVMERNL